MDFFLKNKIAIPISRRFSAAFTAVAAGAVPSIHVKDMQHEGKRTLYPLLVIYSRRRETFFFFSDGSDKAEYEMRYPELFVVSKNLLKLLAYLAFATLRTVRSSRGIEPP